MSIVTTAPSRRRRRSLLSGAALIWVYSFALAAASVALWTLVLRGQPPPPAAALDIPWFAAIPVFFLAEAFVVHVHFRREAHTISLNEVGLVLGFFVLSPVALVVAQLVGAGTALAV